jgi:hypothetical protein
MRIKRKRIGRRFFIADAGISHQMLAVLHNLSGSTFFLMWR